MLLLKIEIATRLILALVRKRLEKTPPLVVRLAIVLCSGIAAQLGYLMHRVLAPDVAVPALLEVFHGGPAWRLVVVVGSFLCLVMAIVLLLNRAAFELALFLDRRHGIKHAP